MMDMWLLSKTHYLLKVHTRIFADKNDMAFAHNNPVILE
jgi:hypothetical protein